MDNIIPIDVPLVGRNVDALWRSHHFEVPIGPDAGAKGCRGEKEYRCEGFYVGQHHCSGYLPLISAHFIPTPPAHPPYECDVTTTPRLGLHVCDCHSPGMIP